MFVEISVFSSSDSLLLWSSVSIIECGPVNTNFMANVQMSRLSDSALDALDNSTLSLYERFLMHCGEVFQNTAQETEDIVKVGIEINIYSFSRLKLEAALNNR